MANGEPMHFDDVLRDHQLVSRFHCSCGWEGDSAVAHIIDAMRLEPTDGWEVVTAPDGDPAIRMASGLYKRRP